MSRVPRVVIGAAVAALAVALGPSSPRLDGQTSSPPILVVLNNTTANPLGNYYAQILRTEGIQSFATTSLAAVTSVSALSNYRLVLLAETALTPTQAAIFGTYVANGGRLIAMRPDADLFATLGITSQVASSTNRPPSFLSATISQSGPGAGLPAMSLPFRGPASHYALAGGTSVVATMSGGTAGGFPAVLRFGRTASWSFDVAKSVAYVRQGDPIDKNLDRDGQPIYRTNDIFYQRLDLQRVNVPHADVHMRLLVRMIETLLADSLPLPRLWYFPGSSRTLMVVTGDSHTSLLPPHTGLLASAESFGARVSIYLSRYGTIPASTLTGWVTRGHEVGLHPYFNPDGLTNNMPGGYTVARNWWQSLYAFPYSPTTRHHSLEWTGWADPALTMQQFGIRMDLSYYAWGPALNNPTMASQAHGYITGSGQPMPFIQENGAVTPVYELVTALTDEQLITGSYAEGMSVPQALAVSRQLVDESQAGFYAAIAAQFHVDYYLYGEVGPWVDGTMAYAQGLQIPMWTSEDYLAFVERRRDTTVTNVAWSANDRTLTFNVALPPQGTSPSSSFTMLVPATFNSDTVTAVAVDGQAVSAPQLVVNGRSVRTITLTRPANGAARSVAVLYGVPTPALAIGDVTVTEGHAGSTVTSLPVTLSTPSTNTITVNYTGAAGTASSTDFQVTPGTLTFAPFETSKTVPATIVGDLVLEPNETFSVTLSNPSNATIEDAIGIVTIADDDTPPTIAVTDATVTEGNAGTVPASFTVSLSHASGSGVTVQYATANGTATAGSDYTAGTGTLTFATGVTTQAVVVPVVGETAAEPNETFTVNLSSPAGGLIGDGQGVGTIINDDSGTVSTTATFQVLSGADDVSEEGTGFTSDTATVWIGSGATPATSFAGLRFSGVAIPPGAVITSARLELRSAMAQWLTIGFEAGIEASPNSAPFSTTSRPSQRILLAPRVTHASNEQWLADTWYLLDELAPLLQPAINQPGWASGNALSLILKGAGQNWARKFATAFEGGAAFAPRLVVTHSFAQGSQPSLSINDVTVTEGNSGTTSATFNVSLSAQTPQVVTATWTTANGTATAGSDYTAATGTVTFPANSTAPQPVTVQVTGDTTVEPNETFVVNLTGPTNATIADAQGVATITNDDAAQASLAIGAASVAEGNAPGTQLSLPVTLTPASSQQVTVTYATSGGTATVGTDFTATSGTLTFQPGETTKAVTVNVVGEVLFEANEGFTVTLSGASGAIIAVAAATGTITNDDTAPTLSIGDVTVTEGTGATVPATFIVTLSAVSGVQAGVTYTVAGVTAALGTDFTATTPGTLTFAPGVTTQQVTVNVVGDAISEPAETFSVGLSAPSNATIADGTATGFITDNDAVPAISIGPATVVEGNAGTVNAQFTVSLSAASSVTVSAAVASASGTATAGSDFTALAPGATITFAPGVTSQIVSVAVTGDTAIELTETFTVSLSAPVNATLGTASGVGTITNDDLPAVSITDVALAEGNSGATLATFTVSLSQASPAAVSVTYATANITATAGSDFTAVTATVLTFPAGTTTLPVSVSVLGDLTSEPNETFAVNLTAPVNATVADAQGVGTITNDDAGAVTVTVTLQIAAAADDVNEAANVLTAGDATNWLGVADAPSTSYTALRFTNVTIPAGATITSARLEGNAASTQWLTIGFEFAAEAAVNSAAFTTTARPSQRTLLTPRVAHSSNVQWVASTWYQLEEIAPILQAVVAQPGWTPGNALSLVLRGTGAAWGRKYIRAFEGGAATAPRLVVTYQVAP